MDHTHKSNAPTEVELSDEAIDWLVRMQSGHASAVETEAFARWRAQSAAHEYAAREAEAIWNGIGTVGAPLLRAEKRKAKVTRRSVIGGGAAAFAGLALLGSGALRGLMWDYATTVGEQRMIALADGSSVLLNATSTLAVDISSRQRRLTLGEGQATFTTAPDAKRPFLVAARDGEIAAGQGMFDIDIRDGNVFVTVLDGNLSVSPRLGQRYDLRANEQIAYAAGNASPPRTVDAERATAWRRGRMIFERRRLDSVLAEIGRYGSGPVIIVNPRLAALEVSGVFETSHPDAVLASLADTLPVRVERTPFGILLL